MQVSVSTTRGLERRLEIAVPAAEVSAEIDQRLKQISRTASLKGFRPGKVPLQVVKKQFGSQVRAEALDQIVRNTFAEAVAQEKLRPASGPRIEPITTEPGADLRYAAVFEVLPEIVVKPVDALAIEKPAVQITDSDIDAMLESMRRQRISYEAVDRASQAGDRVTADFLGKLDGTPFAGGEGKDVPFVIGAGRALPDFENALLGLKAGESRDAEVKFPENYGSPGAGGELAGRTATFSVTAKKVEAAVLPPVDEEFAKAFGIDDGSLASLRAEVLASMEREASEAIRTKLRTQVMDALFRENPLELPQSLVDEQVQELQIDMMRRTGQDMSRADASQAPPREPFVEPARRRVALGLLMGELIRREGLKVERGKVQDRLNQIASAYPNPDEVRQAYLQNADALRQIETTVLEDQAIEWVVAHAPVTERPTTFAELTGFGRTS